MLWCNSLAVPEPARAALNLPRVVPVPAGRTLADVREALLATVTRHEALRTTIEVDEAGDPRQVIHPPARPALSEVESTEDTAADRAESVTADLCRVPLRLSEEWPLRAAVVTVAGLPRFLCLAVHHIAADARALDVLVTELTRALAGEIPVGGPPPRQPRDLVAVEASEAERRRADAALAYWAERLRAVPTALFPYRPDRGRPRRVRVRLDSPALAAALPALTDRLRLPASAVLMAATTAVLLRYTDGTRWFWTTVVDNRPARDYDDAVGSFVQLGMVDVEAGDDPPFATLVGRCWRAQLLAVRHGRYDHDAMLAERGLATEERRTLVTLPTIFNFKPTSRRSGARPSRAPGPGSLARTRVEHSPGQGKPDTTLFAVVHGIAGVAAVSFDADGAVLPARDAEELLRAAEDLVWRAARGSDPRVSDVDVPPRAPDWTRTADGRVLDLDGTARLVRALPGVTAAEVAITDTGAVVATVRGTVAARTVSDHLAAHLHRPGVVLPDQIRVEGEPPEPTAPTAPTAPTVLTVPTAPTGPSDPPKPAISALLTALRDRAGLSEPDLGRSYLGQGGLVRRGPAVVDRLADLGYGGVTFADLLSARPLRSLAAELRRDGEDVTRTPVADQP